MSDEQSPGAEAIDRNQALMDLLGKIEDLHPDLVPYLQYSPIWQGAQILHHKWVMSFPHSQLQNAWVNGFYEQKKKAVAEAIDKEQWNSYVFLHERPYRIDALSEVLYEHNIRDPKIVWPLISSVWQDGENINEFLDEWLEIWDIGLPSSQLTMSHSEYKALKALPDVLTVYRGYGHAGAEYGLSWTTDKAKAEWFAKRYSHDGRKPHVATGTMNKNDVLAFLKGRNESEIVALPDNITVTDVTILK